ncbi:thioesterase [Mayamaea pseudoterrestris]|nr:thioesterase [Mayamaea pseudoterrestris]
MVLIHTPRTLVAIGKGLMRKGASDAQRIGLGDCPHVYTSRVGLLDLDYMGHMNNAAYLSHAELARWQMTTESGMLHKGYKKNCFFVVTASTVRYRKEIRYGKFNIETRFMGFDDKSMWGIHNFYVPNKKDQAASRRVRAQVLVKAAVLRENKLISPKEFYTGILELEDDIIKQQESFYGDESFQEMVRNYTALEESMRTAAALEE